MTLTAPDPNTISSFLNIRVANIQEVYDDWSAKGAQFLTPPIDRGAELRCYLRDPDGHLIEVGQANLAFLEEAFTTLSRRRGRQWSQRGDTVSDHGPAAVRDRSADLATPLMQGPSKR